jgi:hypothetical protein
MRRFAAYGVVAVAVALTAAALLGETWQLGATDDLVPRRMFPVPVTTLQDCWYLARDPVDANDGALADNAKTWGGVQVSKLRNGWNKVTIGFLCYGDGDGPGDPNEGGFDFAIYACRPFSSLEYVCSGSATVGDLRASCLPFDSAGSSVPWPKQYKWAEGSATLVDDHDWEIAPTWTQDANEMGKVSFDPMGCSYVYIHVDAISKLTTIYPLITGR